MRNLLCIILISVSAVCRAQYYFPPTTGNTWDTLSPQSLGWCTDRIDSLYQLLDNKHTKAFIILKDGKIAIEKYFDTFTKDSPWQWNSSGKSLVSFMVGMAQEQQLLSINDSTSKYLGSGWTSCPPEKEKLITIRHQLSMTSGLEYNVPDDDCIDASCLTYKADAGSFWYYYNAPYRLLQDVVANASGQTFQQYTNQKLSLKTGIYGLWHNYTFFSKPRNMARFGLLMLNKGIWNTDTILHDTGYYHDMINTSQSYNQSYGYLWWLNGKSSFKIPGTVLTFNGDFCPPAPDEMYAALGKDDQKLYVWPSKGIVIVRMGQAADGNNPVPIVFDTTLWNELNLLFCNHHTGIAPQIALKNSSLSVYPNPVSNRAYIQTGMSDFAGNISLYSLDGKLVGKLNIDPSDPSTDLFLDVSGLPPGIYSLRYVNGTTTETRKICVMR